PAARLAASDLAEAGVEVIDAAPPGFDLAVSTAFVDATDGRRAVVSGSGRLPVLAEPTGPDLAGVDVVLLDGHHPSLARAVVRAAAASAVPVVVDAGSHKPVFAEVFGRANDVICSADYVHPEGLVPWNLLGLGPELVAVSHGAGDLEWRSADTAGRITPPVVAAVDTLGAGDVLHGGFSFALASGLDRPHALEFGVRVASIRVQHLGPFAWRTALR
ncbi:MAG: PfkB family carbohydrate kinase, partial [Propionicimonas sp.]